MGSGRRLPRYAMRTVSNSAPEFANHEQDIIRQSFSTGNHTWMKEALPVELGPDSVNLLRRQRMERNRLAEPTPQPFSKMSQLWGGGFYQEFEYMPDSYERKHDHEMEMRRVAIEKREKICNTDWRGPSQERRLKHEAMVSDSGSKETYPYLGGDKDAELEASKQWLRSGALSSRSGQFSQERSQLPAESSFLAGKGCGLEDDSRTSRMMLPTIVSRLQRRADADWEGTTVIASVTDQDLIQVAFHMGTLDSERGAMAYMNVLAKDVDLLGSLGLRKVSQLWGMKRDFSAEMSSVDTRSSPDAESGQKGSLEHTWMFFLLAPKWVRMRPTDAYYTVHPRSQGSAFRMSTAGSSVLLSLGTSVFDPSANASVAKDGGSSLAGASSQARQVSTADRGAGARGTSSPGGGASAPGKPATPRVDISLLEQAVSSLPAIRETRGGARPDFG